MFLILLTFYLAVSQMLAVRPLPLGRKMKEYYPGNLTSQGEKT